MHSSKAHPMLHLRRSATTPVSLGKDAAPKIA